MDIQEIIQQLKDKFGDKIDMEKITEYVKNATSDGKTSIEDIIAKVKDGSLLGDLDGDGQKEGLIDEIKGKATDLAGSLGSLFKS